MIHSFPLNINKKHFLFVIVLGILTGGIVSQLFAANGAAASYVAKQDQNNQYYLELKGTIKDGKKDLKDAVITIYNDTTKILSVQSNRFGKCAFKVPLTDSIYTMKVTKEGYICKIISINTKLPSNFKATYTFKFTMNIMKNLKGFSAKILKKPVAKITFNTFARDFDYDYNYTAYINSSLKDLYNDYYNLLQQQERDSAIADSIRAVSKKQKAIKKKQEKAKK